jgi:hypothetical protein
MFSRIKIILTFSIIILTTNIKAEDVALKSNYKYCNHHNFTYFLLDIYDIYLCLNNKNFLKFGKIYQNNFSIFIKYNLNFRKEELAKSSIEEINRYHNIDNIEKYYQKLLSIFPNVKKSDIIEARYKKSKVELYHNGDFTGAIEDIYFGKIFLDIWLNKNNKYQDMIQDLYR